MKGVVLGKFMPPHAGHLHLVEFAQAYCDQLCVLVEKVEGEPIPSELRFAWMQELFPRAEVRHLVDLNPQDPSEHPDFWGVWQRSLQRSLPWAPDAVIASEPYGARLAADLGARFVPVDLDRASVPVSGTQIRADPMRWFDLLPRPVRPYFVRRVRIVGPESTGKSVLARQLAERFGTVWVPEYAEKVIRQQGGRFEESDLVAFARGQAADIAALARAANRVLVADTDPLTTRIWSEVLYGRVAPELAAIPDPPWDLTLVAAPDVPFADDVHRVDPGTRAPFMAKLEAALARTPEPKVALQGDWSARFARAEAAVADLVRPRGSPGPG